MSSQLVFYFSPGTRSKLAEEGLMYRVSIRDTPAIKWLVQRRTSKMGRVELLTRNSLDHKTVVNYLL